MGLDGKGVRVRAFCSGACAPLGGFACSDSVGGGAIHVEGPDDGLSFKQVPHHLVDGGVLLSMVALGVFLAIH